MKINLNSPTFSRPSIEYYTPKVGGQRVAQTGRKNKQLIQHLVVREQKRNGPNLFSKQIKDIIDIDSEQGNKQQLYPLISKMPQRSNKNSAIDLRDNVKKMRKSGKAHSSYSPNFSAQSQENYQTVIKDLSVHNENIIYQAKSAVQDYQKYIEELLIINQTLEDSLKQVQQANQQIQNQYKQIQHQHKRVQEQNASLFHQVSHLTQQIEKYKKVIEKNAQKQKNMHKIQQDKLQLLLEEIKSKNQNIQLLEVCIKQKESTMKKMSEFNNQICLQLMQIKQKSSILSKHTKVQPLQLTKVIEELKQKNKTNKKQKISLQRKIIKLQQINLLLQSQVEKMIQQNSITFHKNKQRQLIDNYHHQPFTSSQFQYKKMYTQSSRVNSTHHQFQFEKSRSTGRIHRQKQNLCTNNNNKILKSDIQGQINHKFVQSGIRQDNHGERSSKIPQDLLSLVENYFSKQISQKSNLQVLHQILQILQEKVSTIPPKQHLKNKDSVIEQYYHHSKNDCRQKKEKPTDLPTNAFQFDKHQFGNREEYEDHNFVEHDAKYKRKEKQSYRDVVSRCENTLHKLCYFRNQLLKLNGNGVQEDNDSFVEEQNQVRMHSDKKYGNFDSYGEYSFNPLNR